MRDFGCNLGYFCLTGGGAARDNYEVRNENYGFCCCVEETVPGPLIHLVPNSLGIFGNDTMKIIEVTI